jgi:hypothetical protein
MSTKGLKVPQSGERTPGIAVAARPYSLTIVTRRALLPVLTTENAARTARAGMTVLVQSNRNKESDDDYYYYLILILVRV